MKLTSQAVSKINSSLDCLFVSELRTQLRPFNFYLIRFCHLW